jgi:hypothetical protein
MRYYVIVTLSGNKAEQSLFQVLTTLSVLGLVKVVARTEGVFEIHAPGRVDTQDWALAARDLFNSYGLNALVGSDTDRPSRG